MGSGLSMTSVNKIKELAATREYSLALEIIDSQDLSKSLNPQFLRLCGEVYIANGRYIDARRILLMAHKMAPEAKRVIYSLIDLYLRMGYKELAEFYYTLYMHDSDPSLPETIQIKYIYNKAQGCPFEEIETLLFPMYSDVMDYDWSFELYLLMKIQSKYYESENIKLDYMASYKNSANAALIEAIEDNQKSVEELFYIYSKDKNDDDSPEQEELREMEKSLLEDDELRINPKEAEIQILFDDNDRLSFGAKLKLKKHLKEEEKLAKKIQDESGDSEKEQQMDIVQEKVEEVDGEQVNVPKDNQDDEIAPQKVNIFKRLFNKKQSEVIENDDIGEEIVDVDAIKDDETTETLSEGSEETNEEVETEKLDEETEENVELSREESIFEDSTEDITIEEVVGLDDEDAGSQSEMLEEEVETAALDSAEQESLDDIGDSVMQEIYEKKKISIVTEVGEDSFVNTYDGDYETGNPFDEIINQNKNDAESDSQPKATFVLEEVELQAEDDEFEVDDFSQDFDLDDFESDIQEETVLVTEEISYQEENIEPEVEEEIYQEENIETEVEEEIYQEENIEPEVEEEIYQEENIETEVEEKIYQEEDTEPELEEVIREEEDIEPEVEEKIYQEEDTEPEVEEEIYQEEDAELEVEEESIQPAVEDVYAANEVYTSSSNPLEGESVYSTLQQKGKLDYPEFKSSLFPEIGESIVSVENNFNEIMTEAQDKINENLLKEEQMQREAEALLASLGIELDFSSPVTNVSSITQNSANTVQSNVFAEKNRVTIPEEVEEQISEETFEAVKKYCPSRDELKASLKIDSVKKNILKQIKEYR